MTMQFINLCRFNAVSAGLGDFIVASAASGCNTPENASVADGKVYYYFARASDGSGQWEYGSGAYLIATHKLVRTAITSTSDNSAKVNFAAAPIVDVFPSPSSSLEPSQIFPAGTPMLFQQTAAPVGWTKQTTHNDKALRIVSGTASSGGSNSFSSVMAQTTVGNHTDSTTEMPSHGHGYNVPLYSFPVAIGCGASADVSTTGANTGSAGSGGAHNHPILMSIQYVDFIIATKN